MIGTMNMYYVTNPDKAVSYIQSFIDDETNPRKNKSKEISNSNKQEAQIDQKLAQRHSLDTREKIRDVLR
jgi:hypothetical protein